MDKTLEDDKLAATESFQEQLTRFCRLFEDAFDELHSAVVRTVRARPTYISAHHDYPSMSLLENGLPSFSEAGFYNNTSPRNFVSTVRPTLVGLLAGLSGPKENLPKGEELKEFLKGSEFGKRLTLEGLSYSAVDRMVADAVERYLHLFGLDAEIADARRANIIRPLIFGSVLDRLEMRLVAPIALTHFEADHIQLTESAFVCRIPRQTQLARSRIQTLGSGAQKMVVGAATHAFISNGWHLEPNDVFEAKASLNQISQNAIDAVDQFFGALRIVTGISTGYAQVVWAPKKWALGYFCDLPTLYGTTIRKYPNVFDNYAWAHQRPLVTRTQLAEVRRVFQAIAANQSAGVAIALRRLNTCLTREDATDALLDAIIGLEVLLGDDQNQSLSYKLRMRVGALAILDAGANRTAINVAQLVKKVYDARSTIVHGGNKKISKKATATVDSRYEQERKEASDLLRFVLNVLLKYPRYLSPTKIDEELLLRGAPPTERAP